MGRVWGSKVPFHSQIGQDRYIFENYFADRRPGRFLDIGAYDGVAYSNTLFFEEELGWQGICIEPLPDVFEKLKAQRKAICLNCCISDFEGTADFLDVRGWQDARMHSGLIDAYDPRHMARIGMISEAGATNAQIQVAVRRLAPILDEHGFERIDYATIDTEGAEYQILSSIDFKRYRFSVLSIENNYADKRITELLAANGFERVHVFHGYDELYVNRSP